RGSRPARTQSRRPVAWIWGGVAVMAVIILAAMVWVFNLAPTTLAPDLAITVPDVSGQTAEAGIEELTEAGLSPKRVDKADADVATGVIISTSIRPGARVNKGEAIDVFVSTGAPSIDLPSLMFLAEADAVAKIKEIGLTYGTSQQQNSPNVPACQVLAITIDDETT